MGKQTEDNEDYTYTQGSYISLLSWVHLLPKMSADYWIGGNGCTGSCILLEMLNYLAVVACSQGVWQCASSVGKTFRSVIQYFVILILRNLSWSLHFINKNQMQEPLFLNNWWWWPKVSILIIIKNYVISIYVFIPECMYNCINCSINDKI